VPIDPCASVMSTLLFILAAWGLAVMILAGGLWLGAVLERNRQDRRWARRIADWQRKLEEDERKG
jgi:hypothetical protein